MTYESTEILGWSAGALAAGAATAGAAYITFAPGSGFWSPVVERGPADGTRRVALTFDDGPTPGASDRVLDALASAKTQAAFFVIGRYAERHPDLVRRMYDEGHIVANHSYAHAGVGFLRGGRFWRREVDRTDAIIEHIIGRRPRLFRPPLGTKTPFIARAAAQHVTITWTRRALDGVSTTPRRILQRLVQQSRPGEILLLHDGVGPQSRRDPAATCEAVEPLIRGLRDRGIEPVRLDTLVGMEAYAPTGEAETQKSSAALMR